MVRFRINCIFLLTSLVYVVNATASDEWIRIDNPGERLKQQLSDTAIVYPHFLWLEANRLPLSPETETEPIRRYTQPFAHNIDNQLFDLSRTQLPAGSWFEDLSLARGHQTEQLYIVQFKGPVKKAWLEDIKMNQGQLIAPLAPFSWIVLFTPQDKSAMSQAVGVRHISYLYPSFRVAKSNRSLSGAMVSSMALVVKDQLQQTKQDLINLGAIIQSSVSINARMSAINFKLSGQEYSTAAGIPGLLSIQKVPADGGSRGEMSQQSMVGAYDGALTVAPGYPSWLSAAGVDGTGITIGVVDEGIHNTHPDLVGQFSPCTGPGLSCGNTTSSHGTHVAGAIGGTGVNGSIDSGGFNRGLGVAPGVKIVEQLFEPLLDFDEPGNMAAGSMLSIYKDSQISGALLTNNSWGLTGSPQGYDIPTMEIDMIARDANPDISGNQPVMPIWSIMNGGGDSFGSCSPSSLGSPDEAKNLFAVGSTKLQDLDGSQLNELFDVSFNSAHGPACDGRLVPHIVAPGCYTDAPDSSSGYGTKCGTSMASPVISGAVSLYWEQYKNTHGMDPSSALIKAVFMVKADDLNGFDDADGNVMGHPPDRKQGWGRANLEAVINPLYTVWLKDQQVLFTTSGEQWSLTMIAENPAEPVKVMLVWTDAAGAGLGGSNPAWVNDLDLTVNTSNDYFLGNMFAADGYALAGGSADYKNNMEGVFLKPVQHQGEFFTLQVMAANISDDALNPFNPSFPRQDFAIVCDNCQPFVDLIFKNGFE